MAVKFLGFLILIALIILLMIVVKKLTPIIKINREAFKKAREEIRKAADTEEKAEADAEKAKVEAEEKAEADAEKAKVEAEEKAEADAEKAKVEAEEKAETEVVARIASELEETYARIDRNTAETMRALEEINVLKKREAKKQSEEKSRSTMAEAKNLYAAVEAVLNTPLDQFQSVKTDTRTVAKIKKAKGGDQ